MTRSNKATTPVGDNVLVDDHLIRKASNQLTSFEHFIKVAHWQEQGHADSSKWNNQVGNIVVVMVEMFLGCP